MNQIKKLKKKFGTAVVQYKLIEENDHILVAVSGGKDSLMLLSLLVEGMKKYPIDFKVTACHLKNELTEPEERERTASYLKKQFETLNVPYIIRDMPVVSTSNSEKKLNCFWCSWVRRKILFDIAKELDIKKIALGHHKDDIIETFLMNLFYHGKIATMTNKLSMFDGKMTLIRPMALLRESDIVKAVKEAGFKTGTCLCPFAGNTKRAYIKEVIGRLEKEFPHIRSNLYNATFADRVDMNYMNK
jgi:tRNA(Ile)-lysidine synthetase-like protein